MPFKFTRLLTTALIISLLIQMQVANSGHAASKARIAFTSTRDGNSEIYVMDSDGGNQIRLTKNQAIDSDPSWSPGGDKIAFVSNRDHGHERIYVMDADGKNLIKLTKGVANRHPAWSPDGGMIAFTRSIGGEVQVYVMDTDGKNQIQLTHLGWNYQPAWSPGGTKIAFVASNRHKGPEIYSMDKDGNNQERLTRDSVDKRNPSWSPDGRQIAYHSLHKGSVFQIFVVETDGSGQTKRLTCNLPHKLHPVWSTDGDTIAYASSVPHVRTTIHLMTADGDHLKQLTEEHGGSDYDPDWFGPGERSVSPSANFVTVWGEMKKLTSGL